jgi:predicted transcriptional regulator
VRTISIKLPADLDEKLSVIARKRHSSRSAVMREALQALAATRSTRPSVTAVAAELVGALQGPADLATSAAHLAGFGE